MTLFQLLAKKNIRMRFRTHFGKMELDSLFTCPSNIKHTTIKPLPHLVTPGSQLECQYALLSFGIPDTAPFDTRGEIQTENLLQYIEKRKEKESQMIHTDVYCPSDNDVLLGRGKPFQEWPGNIQLSNIIDMHRKPYNESDRAQKTAISRDVVQIIKGLNGRFLQLNKATGHWEEFSDAVAREKVGSGFRKKTKDPQSSPKDEQDVLRWIDESFQ
jgi:hypothetical protein